MSQQELPEPKWIDSSENKLGIALLDLRDTVLATTAWTTNKNIVESFARLRKVDGKEYVGKLPDEHIEFDSDLRYAYPGEHSDGPVFKAQAMEDKWDMYLYGQRLYIARSWTGKLCFVANCKFKSDCVEIDKIFAERKIIFEDVEYANRVVDFLIKSHMSGMVVPHPLPARLKNEPPSELAAYSFEIFGRRGQYGSFDETIGILSQEVFPTDKEEKGPEFDVEAFVFWREDRTAAMTLVDLCHGGALYYYQSPYSCTVWVFTNADALLISYQFKGHNAEEIRFELKRLLDALYGTGDRAVFEKGLYPSFAGVYRSEVESLEVACFNPGDWCGLLRAELPPQWDQLPPGWPESERSRIAELAEVRVKMATESTAIYAVNSVGRALGALGNFAAAETVFNRVLDLAEATSDKGAIASSLQSLAVVHGRQHHFDDAKTLLDRAIQLLIAEGGADDPKVEKARNTLAKILAYRDKLQSD